MTPDNRSRIELIAAHYGRRVNARGVLAMPCVVHQGTNPKLELRPGDDDRIRATCYSQGCSYPETARVIEEQTGVRFNPSITGSTALSIVLRLRRGPERPAGPRGPPGAMMDTHPDGSPLRPYAEAIATGLGMEVSGGGDVQALITQLKSTAETAINAPTALEELDGETLAQYQREYLEHFPHPEDLPVDAATPAAWSSWLDAGECLDEALADSNRRLRDLYGTPAQWLWTTGSFLVAAIAIPGMPPWPLALHQVASHWKESSGWRVLHPLFPLMQETMMTPALPRRHITTVALPMRTIRDWLWPNGWHRGRDCPKLLEAFQTINQAWLT